MVNYHEQFRSLLLDGLENVEVYYDDFQEKTAVPCVSYKEVSNMVDMKGDYLSYSSIVFQVKIWAEDLETLFTIASSIDEELAANGFTRSFSEDTTDEGLLVRILRYSATAYEHK